MDAERIVGKSTEPFPRQPVPAHSPRRVVCLGELRLPLAGPYRPRARLYRFPDGRLLWRVRLWEYDQVVPHLVPTDVLRRFARVNRLSALAASIEELVSGARNGGDR